MGSVACPLLGYIVVEVNLGGLDRDYFSNVVENRHEYAK